MTTCANCCLEIELIHEEWDDVDVWVTVAGPGYDCCPATGRLHRPLVEPPGDLL